MYKIIGPLTNPASYGADPADAFDVVVPSLPGYGFSGPTQVRNVTIARMAETFVSLLHNLGYERFAAQGGDWGSSITSALAQTYPTTMIGIHLNMLPVRILASQDATTEAEKSWLQRRAQWVREESGYSHIQGTRPQTLAYGLNDSPAGLAGWIVEKYRVWSDCHGDIERVFTKNELLTIIMIYWVTQTINSSTRLYYETTHQSAVAVQRVEVPTGVAVFPAEIPTPPRSLAERFYNIQRWTELPAGGHFAALEQPQALVEDIRAFFRPLRHER
jgi:pimeloyl-ACP methyl ester carboxylesterase